jgi:FtsP/CotA-like multicopper oxidase with cupredoxin domain
MTCAIGRRTFLVGTATTLGAACLSAAPSWTSPAQAGQSTTLTLGRRTLEVNGRSASVFGIRQPDGTSGLFLNPGQPFRVDLVNDIGEDTSIHWHGQKPPYLQDGVADRNVPLIAAGSMQSYEFPATPGTHWMHSHHGVQEQALLAAPLIVRSAEEAAADVQEVTILLHDFSFRQPDEILAGLTGGSTAGDHVMSGMEMGDGGGMVGMDHAVMGHSGMGGMAGMSIGMDLNDVGYDAFLANDRTLGDPMVVRVERTGRVRLRIINGAASSAFWIYLGGLVGKVVAVDGNAVVPVAGRRFPIAIAQRLDLIIEVPAGAFPVFAQVEGKRERTGFILASAGAGVSKVAELADAEAAPVDLSLETRLVAVNPLPDRPTDTTLSMVLTGSMMPYAWSIDDASLPNVSPPIIRSGQRVVIEMQNRTMMAHPMHLHGHAFQVIALNGRSVIGAVRDTVLVPVMGTVRVAFDADNPGRWAFHCHNLYHMATGMMTEVVYDKFA